MSQYGDSRQDWQDFMDDLGVLYKEAKVAPSFDHMSLADATKKRVMGFCEFLLEEDDRVRVKVNPFKREAKIIILPSDTTQLMISTELKDQLKAGATFTIKF